VQQLTVHPRELRPNPWNTNFVSPENDAKLAASIEKHGMFKPVVVRENPDGKTTYEILGGEHRWDKAIEAGHDEIPIVNLGVITDEQAKEISIIDNARYGADDTAALAKVLGEIGSSEEMENILPYTGSDLAAIMSTSDIALDELELPDDFEKDEEKELAAAKAPKTHTIMRFKVPLEDSERITELIAKTQKRQGLDGSDELTNAGDALVHLLLKDED
jgi:ParB/RepB/Spo0J family partition protein